MHFVLSLNDSCTSKMPTIKERVCSYFAVDTDEEASI
jgi:hypothetical protein